MLIYRVFRKDFRNKKNDHIGTLVERRKDLRGLSGMESGLRWASEIFIGMERQEFFVVPKEVESLG